MGMYKLADVMLYNFDQALYIRRLRSRQDLNLRGNIPTDVDFDNDYKLSTAVELDVLVKRTIF
jgi:hypothetical protein